jgi:hypothetical protein
MIPPLAEDCASTEWMKTLQSSNPMEVILLWISYKKVEKASKRDKDLNEDTNLLTVTGRAVFSLSTMDEGRRFVVETVQTMGRLIHMCIVLRHKLPPHFRWDDMITRGVTAGRSGIRHDEGRVYTRRGGQTRGNWWQEGHTDDCKNGKKNA